MSIIKMNKMLECARKNKFAIGYFESWDMQSTQAVIDAAEMMNSPVIIGYSGVFLNSPKREKRVNIYDYGALAKSLAKNSMAPISIILNEADNMSMLIQSLNSGFNVVMYQKIGEPFDVTIEMNRYLVQTAHYLGADVESEVGELPEANVKDGTVSEGHFTDPEKAEYFVKQTNIDALAVAVGNIHLLEGEKSELNFDLLEIIQRKIKIPLVLHGGTGIAEDEIKHAISLGVAKFNIGTILKRSYLKVIKEFSCSKDVDKINPHELVGMGGSADMLCSARKAITETVIKYIKLFNGENKSSLIN